MELNYPIADLVRTDGRAYSHFSQILSHLALREEWQKSESLEELETFKRALTSISEYREFIKKTDHVSLTAKAPQGQNLQTQFKDSINAINQTLKNDRLLYGELDKADECARFNHLRRAIHWMTDLEALDELVKQEIGTGKSQQEYDRMLREKRERAHEIFLEFRNSFIHSVGHSNTQKIIEYFNEDLTPEVINNLTHYINLNKEIPQKPKSGKILYFKLRNPENE